MIPYQIFFINIYLSTAYIQLKARNIHNSINNIHSYLPDTQFLKGTIQKNSTNRYVARILAATSEGQVAIEQIKPGDMMLSENPETGDVEYKEVLETYENETEELIHVHVGGEDIVMTPSHPFYVKPVWLDKSRTASCRRCTGTF